MTLTKKQIINTLEGMANDTELYVRVDDANMECVLVTANDIIIECNENTGITVDTVDEAMLELSNWDDSIQFYEII